jgi:transposase-like protein
MKCPECSKELTANVITEGNDQWVIKQKWWCDGCHITIEKTMVR